MKPEQQKALNAAATELLRKVDSKTPEELFKLYKDDSTKEAAIILEKDLLKAALSKLKFLEKSTIILNQAEIALLLKYTGITFTDTGDIIKIKTDAPIRRRTPSTIPPTFLNAMLEFEKLDKFSTAEINILNKILEINQPAKSQLSKLTSQKSAKSQLSTTEKQEVFIRYIFACLRFSKPETIITNYTYQNLKDQLLKKLEQIFTQSTPEELKEKVSEINSIFNELYQYIGIKYQFNPTTGKINVVKIKYNAPDFVAELEKHSILKDAEKHSIYVITKEEKTTLLPKRTNKLPEQSEKTPLGKGAFGVVQESFTIDSDGSKPIALKKIKLNQDNIPLIANEILILKQLGLNPISIRIGNNVYIGIPLFPGKTIEATDFAGQPLDTKLNVATRLANELVKIHAKRIWHRDIKGANVITNALNRSANQPLEINIIDFNVSEMLSKLETDKQPNIAGTPGYIAPEFGSSTFTNTQYTENLTNADYLASDIHSLGKLFMYDMGLYNLGIVYKMIDPDYKKRPSIEEVLTALNTYSANKIDIEQQELAIKNMPCTNSQELNAKILAIDGLLKKHNICSTSYYETLLTVLEIGTPEQLKIMINNPMFHNLYVITSNGAGTVLNNPYENKIQELLEICTKRTPPAAECAWLILENLIKLIKEQGLGTWVAKQHLNHYTTFLVDTGLSLGKFNTDTNDLELLKQLGITPSTQKERLESLSTIFITDTTKKQPDSISMTSSAQTSYSSVGPDSPTSNKSTSVLTPKHYKKDKNS